MQKQQLISEFHTHGGQVPPLQLIYGGIRQVLGANPEWTHLLVSDDSGEEILVWVKSDKVALSQEVAQDVVLLRNTSGQSWAGSDPTTHKPFVTITNSQDILFGTAAYEALHAASELPSPVEAAVGASTEAIQDMASDYADDCSQMLVDEPAIEPDPGMPPVVPEALESVHAARPLRLTAMPKPYGAMAGRMLDCLETAMASVCEFVQRHPEQYRLLDAEHVRAVANTLFIETMRVKSPLVPFAAVLEGTHTSVDNKTDAS